MDKTRFLFPSRRPAWPKLALLMGSALMVAVLPAVAMAQGPAPRPLGATATGPADATALAAPLAPRADGLNVLILAFDDMSPPAPAKVRQAPSTASTPSSASMAGSTAGSMSAPAPTARTRVAPIAPAGAPVRPAPRSAPADAPAIRPTSSLIPGLGAIEYRVLAQKAAKAGRGSKGGRPKLTDDDFSPDPLPLPGAYPGAKSTGSGNSVSGASGASGTSSGVASPSASGAGGFGNGVPSASPFALDPSASGAGTGLLGPGRAQAAAAALRRALVRSGFADVLAVAPGSLTLSRAIEGRSLSNRVLEAARVGLVRLASAPAPTTPATSAGASSVPPTAADVATDAAAGAPVGAVLIPAPGLAVGAAQDKRWASLYQAAARVGQALGYRAVIVLGVVPRDAADGSGGSGATYALAVVDALREAGEPVVFDEDGATPAQANESAAVTAAALVTRSLDALPTVTNAEKAERSASYLSWAKAAYDVKDYASAQDYLSQVLVFEPTRAEARLLLADAFAHANPDEGANAWRQALTLEGLDGPTWAKAAIASTVGSKPDWPQALAAARKALGLGYESAELQQAMATAQMGRAALFREAGRNEKADEADADALIHLNRATALAADDPAPARLMASYMVEQGRYPDAVKLLDRIAAQYPDDVDLQTAYAESLFAVSGRDEDAFVAWARVWHLSGQAAVPVDAAHYMRLSEGFDQRLATLGKRSAQLASSVAAGTAARETALLQITRYREDMDTAIAAVRVMQPTFSAQVTTTHASRVFAADLMSQAMASYTTYLETGQEQVRVQANGLQRQAILMLNAARTAP